MVTGASGFIGRHLLNMLLDAANGPKRIIALDKGVHLSAVPAPRIETILCDLTDRPCVLNAIEQAKPDGIIHLAGMTAGTDLSSYFAVNVQACENVLAAAAQMERQPRVLVIGSAAEYGITSGTHEVVDEQRPLRAKTAYGINKIMQESWALLYHLEKSVPVICVRPFNITGPGQFLPGAGNISEPGGRRFKGKSAGSVCGRYFNPERFCGCAGCCCGPVGADERRGRG